MVAAVCGPGYLSTHLNLAERPKDDDYSKSVRVSGIETLETETVYLEWPKFDLEVGDRVEIRVLNEGESDVPSAVRKSSESPQNLFSHPEMARELTELVSDFESRLLRLIDTSKEREPVDEHKKFTTAVGHVLTEIGDHFLYPIYRRHKELVPNKLRGELL